MAWAQKNILPAESVQGTVSIAGLTNRKNYTIPNPGAIAKPKKSRKNIYIFGLWQLILELLLINHTAFPAGFGSCHYLHCTV
jgi:hypothetical protein